MGTDSAFTSNIRQRPFGKAGQTIGPFSYVLKTGGQH